MAADPHHCEEEVEELEHVPEAEKNRDPFFRAKLRRNVNGVFFDAEVEDIERDVVTRETLYRIRYADGDYVHVTAEKVQAGLGLIAV